MGTGGFFQKTSAPVSLMTTYRMSLISAGSISLDVPLKVVGYEKVGGSGMCQSVPIWLEFCLPFNFAVVFDFMYFRFHPSKAK
jgi:hypothetical protein